MIYAEVQFDRHGDLFTFEVPDDLGHGDEVIAIDPLSGQPRKARIVAIGSVWRDAVPVISVIREGGREEPVA